MKQKNMTTGPFGIPMPDNLAKQLDTLIKTLPRDCTYRKAGAVPSTVEFNEGERSDISLITSEALDRENEVVLSKGINKDYFDRNPIVTFAHKYDELPVGRALWVKQVPGGWKAKTQYSEATELARSCWQMTKEGILKGKSIGFLPTMIRSPTKEEVSKNPTWKKANAVIESCLLLEYAVAPIPMNPEALVEAVSKGYASEGLLRKMGLRLPAKKTNDLAALLRLVPKAKPITEQALLLRALSEVDPDKLARDVIAKIASRGRV